jgi:ABC-2 type transport system permease protein
MRQFYVLFKANLISNLRNRSAVFFNLISPLLFFLIFGTIFSKSNTNGGISYVLFLLAGVIVANQLGTGLFGAAAVLVTWRERGVFKRIKATPMPVSNLILARVFSQLVVVLLQAGVVVIVSQLVFQIHPVASGAAWDVAFILLGGLVFLAIGQLLASRARRMETANIMINVLFFPLLFFTNLYFPISLMPDWLQHVGEVMPSYLVVDLLRPAMASGTLATNAVGDIVGLAIYFVGAVAISSRIFRYE